jgi:hypothetical protein
MTLVNNGKALSVGRSRSGLGTHFLEAVTLSFLLSDVTEGVQLQVEVPLATSSGYLRVAAISS